MSDVTIFHKSACGTSRNTLALLRHAGIEPEIVGYLKTTPSAARLRQIVAATGNPMRALLRKKGTPYAELGLDNANWSDGQLIDLIGLHPVLMNQPLS